MYAGGILTKAVLNHPRAEFINAHMGEMPRYRGMNVIEWAVLEDMPTKVAVMVMLFKQASGSQSSHMRATGIVLAIVTVVLTAATGAQRASRPAEDWTATLEAPERVAGLKIPEVVAAMNILIALVMMVMEKHRDIAILISMGARKEQIRRIFMAQGVIIGAAGTIIGLVVGFGVSILADRYQWIRLDAEVYSLNFVPFDPRWIDGVWVAAASILISFLATLYPSRNAARILPAEALRYE